MASQGALANQGSQKKPFNWKLVSGLFIATAGFLGMMAIFFWVVSLQNRTVPTEFPATSLFAGIIYLILALLALSRLLGYKKAPSPVGVMVAAFTLLLLVDQVWEIEADSLENPLTWHTTLGIDQSTFPPVLTATALLALALSYSFTHPEGSDKNVGSLFMSYVALLVPFAATYGYLLSTPIVFVFGNQSGVSIWSAIALTSLAIAQIMIASNHSLTRFKKIALANPFQIR